MILVITNKPTLEPWVNTCGDQIRILEVKGLLTEPVTEVQLNLIRHWVEVEGPHRIFVVDSRTTRCNGINDCALALAFEVAEQVKTVPVHLVWAERGHQHHQIVPLPTSPVQIPLIA